MKNIRVSADEGTYRAALAQAAERKKLGKGKANLEKLWAMSDRKHSRRSGSVGPLNRERLYERGVSRH